MIVVLSPAKAMSAVAKTSKLSSFSLPPLIGDSDAVLQVMKAKSKAEIKSMMSLSDALAQLQFDRYRSFLDSAAALKQTGGNKNSGAAITVADFKGAALVFDGPAYRGMKAETFSIDESNHAQQLVRILSGFYGVIRPFDLIQEYRLEMGTKVPISQAKNLYDYWSEKVTSYIDKELDSQCQRSSTKSGVKVLVNVASAEYFKVIDTKRLLAKDVHVVECVFKDKGRILSVYAKRARGLMARYIVTQNVCRGGIPLMQVLDELRGFNLEGYEYAPTQSTESKLVFNRQCAPPAATADDGNGDGDGEEGQQQQEVVVANEFTGAAASIGTGTSSGNTTGTSSNGSSVTPALATSVTTDDTDTSTKISTSTSSRGKEKGKAQGKTIRTKVTTVTTITTTTTPSTTANKRSTGKRGRPASATTTATTTPAATSTANKNTGRPASATTTTGGTTPATTANKGSSRKRGRPAVVAVSTSEGEAEGGRGGGVEGGGAEGVERGGGGGDGQVAVAAEPELVTKRGRRAAKRS